jgi:hypothetical protein
LSWKQTFIIEKTGDIELETDLYYRKDTVGDIELETDLYYRKNKGY